MPFPTNVQAEAKCEVHLHQLPTGSSGVYRGQSQGEMKHGKGVLHYQLVGVGRLVYEGDFVEDKKHGRGILTWPDGRQYKGQFVNDEIHGQGTMTWPDHHKYVGEYTNGKEDGKGTLFYPDGSKYVGQFHQGMRHGEGKYVTADGKEKVSEWDMDRAVKDEVCDPAPSDSESTTAPSEPGCNMEVTSNASKCTGASSSSSQKSVRSQAPTAKNPQRWRVVDYGGVVVRVSDSLKSKKLGVLPQNTELDVVKISGRRLCVANPVDGWDIGWVSSRTEDDLVVMKRIDHLDISERSSQSTQSISSKMFTKLSNGFRKGISL